MINLSIPYKTKFWREKILANLTDLPNLPKLSYPIKKLDFRKLSCRKYSLIYYPPIIADRSFAKIFSLQNFVSYSIMPEALEGVLYWGAKYILVAMMIE